MGQALTGQCSLLTPFGFDGYTLSLTGRRGLRSAQNRNGLKVAQNRNGLRLRGNRNQDGRGDQGPHVFVLGT